MSRVIDQAPFDLPWTPVHVAVGLVAGALKVNPWLYGAAIALYEVVENADSGLLNQKVFKASGPESMVNSVADVGVGLVGYAIARYWVQQGE